MPRATAVIPTYRRPVMLREAIRSALAQTSADLEVVVTVDGDDAETAGLVADWPDDRVRVLWDGHRRGEAGNTVRGILAARSEFVGILHDDDTWEPDLLETLLPPLETDPTVTLSFADHYVTDAAGAVDLELTEANSSRYRRTELEPGRHQPFRTQVVLDLTVPAVMTTVYRKDALDFSDLPRTLTANFDLWLAWVAVRAGGAAHYDSARLSVYRTHDAQGTVTATQSWLDSAVVLGHRFLEAPELAGERSRLRGSLGDAYRRRAVVRRAAGERADLAGAVRGVRLHPTAKNVVGLALTVLPASVARLATR